VNERPPSRRAHSVKGHSVKGMPGKVVPLPCGQGRARGLYDEQLQRQQQEKLLARGERSAFFGPAKKSGKSPAEAFISNV